MSVINERTAEDLQEFLAENEFESVEDLDRLVLFLAGVEGVSGSYVDDGFLIVHYPRETTREVEEPLTNNGFMYRGGWPGHDDLYIRYELDGDDG